ncbi:cytochrome c maturation protein CcmE [Parahaliea maris]|uniref:Cytochrome c-type biogenesis protein CcmE n=1 Tax=Parahaliea maris TaxID=2716870 RepID=A0A5C9A7P0_9GAMM|nr:cytochrome c maturation protein CcmE [Parahaliea maris]TXS95577.1 cytochrome c maturation protein CcmE [Parahaliea maris]
MHPVRKQRLIIVLCVVVFSSAAIGLMAYALRGNINLFFPPVEVAAGKAPVGQPIRVGGMVVDGSVQRSDNSLHIRFEVTDYQASVPVVYEGILPDLFDEGQGAVAAGVLDENGVLQATEVLAKHDENYMPPEVAEALEASKAMDAAKAKGAGE